MSKSILVEVRSRASMGFFQALDCFRDGVVRPLNKTHVMDSRTASLKAGSAFGEDVLSVVAEKISDQATFKFGLDGVDADVQLDEILAILTDKWAETAPLTSPTATLFNRFYSELLVNGHSVPQPSAEQIHAKRSKRSQKSKDEKPLEIVHVEPTGATVFSDDGRLDVDGMPGLEQSYVEELVDRFRRRGPGGLKELENVIRQTENIMSCLTKSMTAYEEALKQLKEEAASVMPA